MLAKHMNSVRQRWRTNLSPFSITRSQTRSGLSSKKKVACPAGDSGGATGVNKFTKGLDILTNRTIYNMNVGAGVKTINF